MANENGKQFIGQIRLRPRITVSGDKRPTAAEIEKLHHRSHDACFIANSIKSEVTVEAIATVFA
jgi:organic hydroperoxide reductase OsmC/OhrA